MACETEGRDIPKYRANFTQNFPHQIPKVSITCTDKQYLQPVKGRFFSSRPRKSFRSQSSRKNILAIQTPGNDMINRTGHIESSVSRHATMIGISQININ
jgi:hypothetical protein